MEQRCYLETEDVKDDVVYSPPSDFVDLDPVNSLGFPGDEKMFKKMKIAMLVMKLLLLMYVMMKWQSKRLISHTKHHQLWGLPRSDKFQEVIIIILCLMMEVNQNTIMKHMIVVTKSNRKQCKRKLILCIEVTNKT